MVIRAPGSAQAGLPADRHKGSLDTRVNPGGGGEHALPVAGDQAPPGARPEANTRSRLVRTMGRGEKVHRPVPRFARVTEDDDPHRQRARGMFVAGTLENDQDLIENIATVMQGARVGARGADDEEHEHGIELQLALSGRDGPEPEEPA
jgi:hypothetical protein